MQIRTLLFIIALISFFIYLKSFLNPPLSTFPIQGDGEAHYAYLPALILDRDISVSEPSKYESNREYFQYPAFNLWPETGKYLNKYPPGTAILVLPFFFLATLFSLISHQTLGGYNIIYRFLVGAAASFYLFSGLVLLKKAYRQFFSKKITSLTLICLVFSSSLFHYTVFDSLYSHVFAFFAISLSFYLILKWHEKPNSFYLSTFLGISFGLNFLIRNSNIFIFLFFLLYSIYSPASFKTKLKAFLKNHKNIFVILIFTFLSSLPQLIYYRYITGHWWIFSYKNESFNWLNPTWYGVLLSPRKGLFFWAPVFLVCLPGFIPKKKIPTWYLASLVFLFLQTYIIASWHQWWYGDSFGHRGFIDSYPIIGLFFARGLEFLDKGIRRYFAYLFLILCILLNLFLVNLYWQHYLPRDHTTFAAFLKVLGIIGINRM